MHVACQTCIVLHCWVFFPPNTVLHFHKDCIWPRKEESSVVSRLQTVQLLFFHSILDRLLFPIEVISIKHSDGKKKMQMLLNVIFIMIREYSLSGNQQDLKPLVVENTAGECSCSRSAQLLLVLVLIVRSVIVLNYGQRVVILRICNEYLVEKRNSRGGFCFRAPAVIMAASHAALMGERGRLSPVNKVVQTSFFYDNQRECHAVLMHTQPLLVLSNDSCSS